MSRSRLTAALGVMLLAILTSGCATPFVDTGLKDVAASEYMKPPQPRPVQLLFTFQTKGAANARATKLLIDEVTQRVQSSGLFSSVSKDPAEGGALLGITINNVVLTDDYVSKGFATGLTLGLAGNTVTDGYICTFNFTAAPGSSAVQVTEHHAIHTNVGAKSAPPHSVKAKSLEDAVRTVVRQAVDNGLKELSLDPRFLQ